MKVLFQAYNTCCQNASGGVQVRIKKIRDLLIDRGCQVDYYSPFESKVENYDVLHIFKLTIECLDLILCAKSLGVKVILSSIVGLDGGLKLDIYRLLEKLPFNTYYHNFFESIKLCDHIIVETNREKKFLMKHYRVDEKRISVTPNGVDLRPVAKPEIFKYIGGVKKYILQVGRFDSNKNQINVIKALKHTDIPVVFIGGAPNSGEQHYYNICRNEAKNSSNFFFLGWQASNSELLNSAYQYAQALILPSYFETFGLVALEAAEKNIMLCMSNTLPILEYNVFDPSLCFSPNSLDEIKTAVTKAMKMDKFDNSYNKLIVKTFSWERIIDEYLMIYEN